MEEAMTKLEWLRTETPGELVANGAPFRIVYESGKYALYHNGKRKWDGYSLVLMKYDAQNIANDLQEVGLLELDV